MSEKISLDSSDIHYIVLYIARHRVVCPCNGTFLKALCSILVSQLLSYPVKFRTFALSHLSLRRIALT